MKQTLSSSAVQLSEPYLPSCMFSGDDNPSKNKSARKVPARLLHNENHVIESWEIDQ